MILMFYNLNNYFNYFFTIFIFDSVMAPLDPWERALYKCLIIYYHYDRSYNNNDCLVFFLFFKKPNELTRSKGHANERIEA